MYVCMYVCMHVGGLLQSDWSTPVYAKLAMLERMQKDPSVLSFGIG